MPRFIFILFSILYFSTSCKAQNTDSKEASSYTFTTPSRDGTGKVYLGREISQIMGFQGKAWLERASREREEGISLALQNLPINESSVVADIGAGSGYYTFRIAPKVPKGKVFAVEIQDEAIQYLDNKSRELEYSNVIAIKGTAQSPNLPDNSIDLAIMVDVYHELSHPKEMLTAIRKALKPDGKILLLEYRGEDPSIPIKPLHKMTVDQAVKELGENGFELIENGQFLKIQHFLVFGKSD